MSREAGNDQGDEQAEPQQVQHLEPEGQCLNSL